jgi:hypothetical protein
MHRSGRYVQNWMDPVPPSTLVYLMELVHSIRPQIGIIENMDTRWQVYVLVA